MGDDPALSRLAGGVRNASFVLIAVPLVLVGGTLLYARHRRRAWRAEDEESPEGVLHEAPDGPR